jgi:hypothetical protein
MKTNNIAKDDALFFDTLEKAVNTGDRNIGNQISVALNAFMMKPKLEVMKNIQAFKKIQAVASSTDFAKLVSDAFNVTIGAQAFDLGYEQAFKSVPLGTREDTWDIYDVQNALAFHLIPEGNSIHLDELSGSVVTAHVDYYGGGLGWTDKMIRYRKVAAMVDMAMIFRNRFWSNKAANHYLLVAAAAALAGNTTAWQAGGTNLLRDIATLNLAAFTLTNRLRNKGYDPQNMAAANLLLYANPLDKTRIAAALTATRNTVIGATTLNQQVDWSITPIYTYDASIVHDHPVLVLPGNKMQRADDMQPTTFTKPQDPLTLNLLQTVWAIYGAIIADTEQVMTVDLV